MKIYHAKLKNGESIVSEDFNLIVNAILNGVCTYEAEIFIWEGGQITSYFDVSNVGKPR